MKLKPLGANATELTVGAVTILFSYQTPVACHIEGEGYFKTEHKWSNTTSRHVSQWLRRHGARSVNERPQAFFDDLTMSPRGDEYEPRS